MLNYVMVVVVLTAMSWITFVLDKTQLNDRQGLTLDPISAQLELTLPFYAQLRLTFSPISPT
jgi:hypothetical protein